MRATKKTQYALRALIVLAREKEPLSLRVIAQKESISFDYLEKIFSRLEKRGLVVSKRGAQGGYLLACDIEKLTLKDVFNAVDEPIALVDCLKRNCPLDETCKAIKAWKKINRKMEEAFSSVKLSDLL
jgi:Rrf2 family transcriptional regulator, iron-sulfur cluster assembly transcription factor